MTQASEVVIYPPKPSYIESLPLLADIQFLEPFSSEALNRKFLGIVPAAIYRGFDVVITGDNTIEVGSSNGLNTALVERDSVAITVQGQHPVELSIPYDQHVVVVIEANYQHGLVTKQVDISSSINAAEVKVIPFSDIQPHHLTICEITLPAGEMLSEALIDKSNRPEAGALDTPNVIKTQDDDIALNKLNIFKVIKPIQLPDVTTDCICRVLVLAAVTEENKQPFTAPNGKKVTVLSTGEQHETVNVVIPNLEYKFMCIDGEWMV
ncbi:hypothetical protein [Vibrio campbellii]|uniref:hypothetical protein n=1 Tax=Vibrio campbellii TaxID=680 RepID=UPI00210E7A90|nr:hypothetical protein [Vibrio campbellii]UTZ44611.1 hypothetical protein HB764_25465 [Vibrio campbellii]